MEDTTMDEITHRVKRAAEGILENESLTSGWDDAAANALLEWGIACAKMIAESTDGLDRVEAERIISPRLRAARRLMRRVKRWVTKRRTLDSAGGAVLMAEIIEQAAIIYGKGFAPPDEGRQNVFLRAHIGLAEDPVQMIGNLRALLEKSSDRFIASTEKNDDQETQLTHLGEGDDQEEKDRFVCLETHQKGP